MLRNILENFCSNTNLHGFAYIVQPSRTKIERFFWILLILTSFTLTGILIRKLLLEDQNNPTVIYTDQNAIKIEELNFPAVTICPGLVYKTICETIIDYEVIKSQLLSGELNIHAMSIEDRQLLQVASLVARDSFLSDNFPLFSIPTDNIVEVFQAFNLTLIEYPNYQNILKVVRPYESPPPVNFFADYARQYSVYLRHSLTEFGPCFTFNAPKLTDFYNTNITNEIHTTEENTELIALFNSGTFEFAKILQLENISYPVKGRKEGLYMVISTQQRACNRKTSIDSYNHFEHALSHNTDKLGFEVIIHDPYETLPSRENHFTLAKNQLILLSVTPKISSIDSSLVGETLKVRRCYLRDEKQLDFFKVYTKANCEHECLTQMTLKSCGCVQYFMVRSQNTKICEVYEEKCFRKIEKEFDENKLSCKCYDPCDNVKYEVKLQNTESESVFSNDPTLHVRTAVDDVFATKRRKTTTIVDFLSFAGGLLGLFAGFSFVSAAEIIYYFLVEPLMKLKKRNSSRVQPFDSEQPTRQKSRIMKFVKEILQNSSIHSLGSIGSSEKSLIERLSWLTLFSISITFSFLMMKEVFQKFHDNSIVLKFENAALKIEEVPFPALTVVQRILFRSRYDFPNSSLEFRDKKYIQKLYKQVEQQALVDWTHADIFEFNSSSDFVELLKFATARNEIPFRIYSATFNANYKLDFAMVLTTQGFGRSFNLMEQSSLLNLEVTSKDFHYNYGCEGSCKFPLKTSLGENKGHSVEFDIWGEYLMQHFYIIHPPNELPLTGHREGIQKSTIYDILVSPSVVKADEDLKSLDVKARKCYFDDERKLKFFKIYTQKNCEMECLSNVVYDECRCVPYNYIRDTQMDVCDQYSTILCFYNFENIKASDYDHLYESHGICGCLPACNEVKYSYEVYKSRFEGNLCIRNSLIQMKWKDSEYYAMIRVQEFKLVDFFSYAGGILGLFAGISVLSIIEIFYFLTLRLITDLIRSLRH